MNADEIAQKVEEGVRSIANIEAGEEDFTRDAHLFELGYIDSFSAVELVSYCEKTFEIEISNDELALCPMNTVNEITKIISDKLA